LLKARAIPLSQKARRTLLRLAAARKYSHSMASENGVILDQVLRPSPPLSPRALFAILCLVAAVNVAVALYFALRGAWPIAPFLGGDVALLAWAFRASLIAARREEHVTLTRATLRISRRPPRGRGDEICFNPYWVRVDMDDPPEHWSQLTLWTHGKGLKIGTFLAPEARAQFALSLKSALRRARETTG
jgi:uncharacterized membrane protein